MKPQIDYSIVPFYVNETSGEEHYSKKRNREKYLEVTLLKLCFNSKKIIVGVQNEGDADIVKRLLKIICIENVDILLLQCSPKKLPLELCKAVQAYDIDLSNIIFFNEADQFLTNTYKLNELCDILKTQKNTIYSPHRIDKLYNNQFGIWVNENRENTFNFYGDMCAYPNTDKNNLTSDKEFYQTHCKIEAYGAAWLTTFETFKQIPFHIYDDKEWLEAASFAIIENDLKVFKTTDNSFSVIHLSAYEHNARSINVELTAEQIIQHHRKFLYNEL